MTRPTEVTVQVADLELLQSTDFASQVQARKNLLAAIPKPWEPTDEQVDAYIRARSDEELWTNQAADHLRALHREGLIP